MTHQLTLKQAKPVSTHLNMLVSSVSELKGGILCVCVCLQPVSMETCTPEEAGPPGIRYMVHSGRKANSGSTQLGRWRQPCTFGWRRMHYACRVTVTLHTCQKAPIVLALPRRSASTVPGSPKRSGLKPGGEISRDTNEAGENGREIQAASLYWLQGADF